MRLPRSPPGVRFPWGQRIGNLARIAEDSPRFLIPKPLEFLGVAEVAVCMPLCEESQGICTVAHHAPALEDRFFIPVDAEPTEPIEDDLHHLLRGPILIGILDSEEEDSPLPAGHQPVEEGGPCTPHMEVSGG
jgi:hypothetical protein